MLLRKVKKITVTISLGESESEMIDFSAHSGGIIFIPDAWTAANLGFLVNYASNGTYLPLKQPDGTLVEIDAVVDSAFSIPVDTFGITYMKLQSQTGGTPVTQAADRTIVLTIKS